MSGTARRDGAAALVVVLVTLAAATAAAQDNPDRQVWGQVLALGALGDHWRTHVEVQPRVMNDASELGLTIVRTGLGRRVTPRMTLFLGHAWIPRTLGAGVRHEQRLWQQMSVSAPAVAGWSPSLRLRLEQRWLAPWPDTAHRARVMVRGQRALASTPWSLFAYDELMVNLDRTTGGPARGFDRNRVAGGVTRRWSPVVSADLGYLWEHSAIPAGRRNDHVVVVVLNLSVPR